MIQVRLVLRKQLQSALFVGLNWSFRGICKLGLCLLFDCNTPSFPLDTQLDVQHVTATDHDKNGISSFFFLGPLPASPQSRAKTFGVIPNASLFSHIPWPILQPVPPGSALKYLQNPTTSDHLPCHHPCPATPVSHLAQQPPPWSPILVLVPYGLFPREEPEDSDKIAVRSSVMFLPRPLTFLPGLSPHTYQRPKFWRGCRTHFPLFPALPPPSLRPHEPAGWCWNPASLSFCQLTVCICCFLYLEIPPVGTPMVSCLTFFSSLLKCYFLDIP